MSFPLFTSPEALGTLLIAVIATVLLVYFPFFWLFFGWCHLDGPLAIRWAWTVGVIALFVYLMGVSQRHAQYLVFWRGELELITNFLLLAIPAFLFLVLIWIKRPQFAD